MPFSTASLYTEMNISPNILNSDIKKIWEECLPSTNSRVPLFFPEFGDVDVLFIGINPSFSQRGFNTQTKGSSYDTICMEEYFSYPQHPSFSILDSLEMDALAHKLHPYFRRFHNISEELSLTWTHIDLFFVRETSQKKVREMIFNKYPELSVFGERQLTVAKKLIAQSKPRIIVVVNALASRIFEHHIGAKFDNELGCHITELSGKPTPAILGSMLTGQRALDNYSFQRLKWQINHVLNSPLLSARRDISI